MGLPLHLLPQSLLQATSVPLRSDSALADRVRTLVQLKAPDLDVQAVPEIVASGRSLPIAPWDLLHGLGRATSSFPALTNASLPGIGGYSALQSASQWAMLKYLWAFEPAQNPLMFSSIVKTVRAHQRAVFSEQMGIALGTAVVERFLLPVGKHAFHIVDADALQDDPQLRVAVEPLAMHRPDYFFYTDGPDPTLIIVEVKGTRTDLQTVIGQLVRGVAQVSSVPRVDGYQVRRIVVGALAANGLRAYAVEVPDFTDDDSKTRRIFKQVFSSSSRDVKPTVDAPHSYELSDVDDLPTTVSKDDAEVAFERGEDARLLTVAGLDIDRNALTSDRQTLASRARELSTSQVGDQTYSGITTSLTLPDTTTLELFSGVRSNILFDAADGVSTERKAAARRSAWSDEKARRGTDANPASDETLVSQSSDGCAAELRIRR